MEKHEQQDRRSGKSLNFFKGHDIMKIKLTLWSKRTIITMAGFCLMLMCELVHADDANAPKEKIPVNSAAFVFSPGNWTGDSGRGGQNFRQTWTSGAYFRVKWESGNPKPAATLLLDSSSYSGKCNPPLLTINVDGVWMSRVPCANEIKLDGLQGSGKHSITVFLSSSEQKERWGSEGVSGSNVLRVTGLLVDEGSKPIENLPSSKWILIVGDSITEGIGTSELAPYSHLVGEAFRSRDYEYCVSACGWSGWLNKGDNPPGDVPGYYLVTGSDNGLGGTYDEKGSRWNRIDGSHSLLDDTGHISAYGSKGQEPSLILINYGTNDILHKSNKSDMRASISQCLVAFRKSAPNTHIVMLIPFGQFCAEEIKEAVKLAKGSRLSVIDLGADAARSLNNGIFGGLHPSDKGHANFAAQIIPQLMAIIDAQEK